MNCLPEIRRRLGDLGKWDDDDIGLTETALLLAAIDNRDLDFTAYERHLEKLTDDVSTYAGAEADHPERGLEMRAEALRQVLILRYGYLGHDDAYDDAGGANLMRVIDRRRGQAIMLGILYIHVARALDWRMDGLDFPPRFLVRLEMDGKRHILDPYSGGREIMPNDMRDLYKAIGGPQVELSPDTYAPMSNRAILLRSRRNIKTLHLRSERLEDALKEAETLLLFAPKEASLWREVGILNARLDRIADAITALEEFLHLGGGDKSRYRASILLQELRTRLN